MILFRAMPAAWCFPGFLGAIEAPFTVPRFAEHVIFTEFTGRFASTLGSLRSQARMDRTSHLIRNMVFACYLVTQVEVEVTFIENVSWPAKLGITPDYSTKSIGFTGICLQ